MRLAGGRTAKRAVVCTAAGADRADARRSTSRCFYGDRVAVLGSNGSGKSHFLRLLARRWLRSGRRAPAGFRRADRPGAAHRHGRARLAGAAGLLPADPRALRAEPAARCWRSCTGATSTGPGWAASRRRGRWTGTGWPAPGSRRSRRCPAASRRGMQILLLELSGATLMLAGRAHRQPRPALGRGAGAGARRVRRDGHRGHPRPGVRPHLRLVPDLRRGRRRSG